MTKVARLIIPLLAGLALGGCKDKATTEPAAAMQPAGAVQAATTAPAAGPAQAGPRRIDIQVGKFAYKPERITGKPGEPVVLVFHYSRDSGECGHELLLPDQRKLVLDPDKPTEVAMTMPTDKKELGFTCGMNMLRGTIVVE